ncbi:hypothetical protein A2U01_0036645, partial [Trifolium medium]|nr:hypothetical protein [Trifolium medium]
GDNQMVHVFPLRINYLQSGCVHNMVCVVSSKDWVTPSSIRMAFEPVRNSYLPNLARKRHLLFLARPRSVSKLACYEDEGPARHFPTCRLASGIRVAFRFWDDGPYY